MVAESINFKGGIPYTSISVEKCGYTLEELKEFLR